MATATTGPEIRAGFAQDAGSAGIGQLNAETTAGPWKLTASQFSRGSEAAAQILAASDQNSEAVAGIDYLLIYLSAVNTSTVPLAIDFDDFAFFGTARIVRRAFGLLPPNPALQAVVQPGQMAEGWVIGAVESGDATPFMLFDQAHLAGTWADRVFALTGGDPGNGPDSPAVAVNETGKNAGIPAVAAEVVATADWVIELQQSVFGQDVYDLFPASDYRTTAVGDSDPSFIPFWIALQFQITNNRTGNSLSHFPVTAFGLAWEDGSPLDDVPRLTPPSPDAGGDYLAGGMREGWIAFERPAGYEGSLVRFQPFGTDQHVRFVTWGDGSAPEPPTIDPTPAPPDQTIPAGTPVTVTEKDVNMRDEASIQGNIVETLSAGELLTVTGEPVENDALIWYPVDHPATGMSGFVAANFIRPES